MLSVTDAPHALLSRRVYAALGAALLARAQPIICTDDAVRSLVARERLHAFLDDAPSTRARARANGRLFVAAALELSARLAKAEIPHVFLKGVASDVRLFGGIGLRGTSDIDVVVADLAAAERVLAPQIRGNAIEHRRPLLFAATTTRTLQVQLFAHDVAVDMTSTLLVDPPFFDATAAVLARSQWVKGLPMLCDTDAVVYAAGNLLKDRFSGRYKLALDVAGYALRGGIDAAAVVRRARQWRVAGALWAVLRVVADDFGVPVPQHLLQALMPSPVHAQLLTACMYGAPVPSMLTRTVGVDSWQHGGRHALRYGVARLRDALAERENSASTSARTA